MMRTVSALLCRLPVLALVAGAGGAAAQAPYADRGLLLPSAAYGYTYAYGPALVRDGDRTLMIYCSSPSPGDATLDYLRISTSLDGFAWSTPAMLLRPTDPVAERAACDPSLVRYQAPNDHRPWWYLFYSGFPTDVGTAMFVARADRPDGPYAKWTGTGWEVDAPRPRAIVGPSRANKDAAGFYGAGQQSVVVRDGQLVAWWTDDTTCEKAGCFRIFTASTTDPTRWPPPEATDLPVGTQSVDVKLDGQGRFVMYAVDATHSAGSHLSRRVSTNGRHWSAPEVLAQPPALPPFSHNLGVEGDARGHTVPNAILVYGAPEPGGADCGICWGRWDLRGGTVGGAR